MVLHSRCFSPPNTSDTNPNHFTPQNQVCSFACAQYCLHPDLLLSIVLIIDICHELLGHAPMFADTDFADFSQEIGLASLGASDEEIKKLAALYWFTVEFGMVRDSVTNELKAYGAGLLSSCGELEYSCTSEFRQEAGATEHKAGTKHHEYWETDCAEVTIADVLPFDPHVASTTEFPITHYQPKYFAANSLNDVKLQLRKYCSEIPRPFHVRYNNVTGHVWVDRAVKRQSHQPASAY